MTAVVHSSLSATTDEQVTMTGEPLTTAMKPPCHLLIVDDDRAMGEMLLSSLQSTALSAEYVGSGARALDRLERGGINVIVTDVRMGHGMSGIELAARVHESYPDVPVIVITAFGSLETAIAAIRAGAYDFVPKPFEPDELLLRVRRAFETHALREEVRRLRDARGAPVPFESLIGKSPTMERVFALIDRIAQSSASVSITGETGTGKELVARAIHARSRRATGPFIAVNCAAIPEPLLESELFGHTRGSFTDARSARTGLFLHANGGTIFLDEIGDLPKLLQARLLRALQEHCVRPVGSDREVPFDARVIASTNRDLESAVSEGHFREDLFFRLNVLEVALPPLRSRGNDVLVLAQEFIRRIARRDSRPVLGISPDCARLLLEYSWPGNVRELLNVIERAVALAGYENLMPVDLPERIRQFKPSHVIVAGTVPEDFITMDEVERRYILRVLEATHGHRTRTAEILGLDRKTLYNKLRAYGVTDTGTTAALVNPAGPAERGGS